MAGWSDLIAPVVNAGTNIYNTWSQNEANKQNLQFAKDTLEYQKGVQQTTWNREDNAVQRRVADLRQAGLSPVLAAGSAASSSAPIQVSTPQKQANKAPNISESALMYLNIAKMQADISRTSAENDLIQMNKKKVTAETLETMKRLEKETWNLDIAKTQGMPTDVGGVTKQLGAWANAIGTSKPVQWIQKNLFHKMKKAGD